ncbi:MAG: DEAD/DEAH box helicase, partial [Wenzhouxiangellaceae bacterium]
MTQTDSNENTASSAPNDSASAPERVLSDVSFAEFDLPDAVRRGLEDAGFSRCTPIQADTLPRALSGGDVAGQARTGTGKTAAFLLAIFNTLLRDPDAEGAGHHPRAIVIAPAHIVHGSTVTTSVQPDSRQPSPKRL